jgi:hypothetical protein
MAFTKLARRSAAPKFRRGPSPLVAKLKNKLTSANKRAREGGASGGNQMVRDVMAVGGAAVSRVQHAHLPSRGRRGGVRQGGKVRGWRGKRWQKPDRDRFGRTATGTA